MNHMMFNIIVKLFATMILTALLTPLVRKLAFKIGATDKPDARRVNTKEMPTIGGLAIFISYAISVFIFMRNEIPFNYAVPIFLGAAVIIFTGLIDDIKELSPRQKMLGIIIAALIIYFLADVRMDLLKLPLIGEFRLGWLSLPVTLIWIISITNAVNLIDGLDGLATGVSIIALFTMGTVGYFFLNGTDVYISLMVFALVAALIGFLPYNFYPAKIFLGDTGALFLGFMIAVMSLQGLKTVTFITVAIPVVILGVPITDTVYAILRRLLNKKPISSADKMHLHHRLMQLGLTHRQTVLVIYALAVTFSFIALLYPLNSTWGNVLLTICILIALELFVEMIGLLGQNWQPLLNIFRKVGSKNRNNHDEE